MPEAISLYTGVLSHVATTAIRLHALVEEPRLDFIRVIKGSAENYVYTVHTITAISTRYTSDAFCIL
jgi:hypothetical protein